MAELFGRATGCSRGRGGSMHLFAPEVGLLGTSGIVGPSILMATGAGYSFRLLGTDRVSVAFFGDGAVNNGAFHEGLNLAAIWQLPVLFVCENNLYATEVPFADVAGNPDVARAGRGLRHAGRPASTATTCSPSTRRPARRCGGRGAATGRRCSSASPTARAPTRRGCATPATARARRSTPGRARCPIARWRERLLGDGRGAAATDLDRIDQEVAALVDEAAEFAEASPWPDPATATRHVYAEPGEAPLMRELTFTEAAREGLAEEMARDPSVFVVGEGIGARGGNFNTTVGLFERHGAERLRDTPISERGFTGLCTGAAMTGARPVVDFMFFDFALDALGELLNQTSKIQYMTNGRLKMPIVLRGCVGVGHSAATHHSGSYYPIFTNIPGFRVVVPDDAGRRQGPAQDGDPVRRPGGVHGAPLAPPDPRARCRTASTCAVRPGRGRPRGHGRDGGRHRGHGAAGARGRRELAREGVSVEVIDPRTLAPLDLDTILESVHKTGRLLVADESFGPCGIGAEIAAQVADRGFDDLDAPIRRLNGLHAPTPYSPPLEKAVVPDVDAIVRAIRDLRAE